MKKRTTLSLYEEKERRCYMKIKNEENFVEKKEKHFGFELQTNSSV